MNSTYSIQRKTKYLLITTLVFALTACGGGGGSGGKSNASASSTSAAAVIPPPETLFVSSNTWAGPALENAQTVTADEFRRMQVAGELQVMTVEKQQAQDTARQNHINSERTFLESKTDLSDDVKALLAQATIATDIDAKPATTLPNGQQVALLGLGTRIEKAAEVYRKMHDPANALASYKMSYSVLSDELKLQVPTPTSLQNETLDQIQQATQKLNGVLTSVISIDKTRLDLGLSPASPIFENKIPPILHAINDGPGYGSDSPSTACAATGLAKRYWYPLKNFVSPVRDQGWRGTCWAFAAIAAVESRERVQNNKPVNLSEQYFVNHYKFLWFPDNFNDGGSASGALNASTDYNETLADESTWTYNPATGRPANAFDKGIEGTLASYSGACNGYRGWCSPSAHQGKSLCAKVGGSDFCGASIMSVGTTGISAGHARLVWPLDDKKTFDLQRYRDLLSNGVSLIASLPVYEAFHSAPSTGIISDYHKQIKNNKGDLVDGDYGGHLVQIVGFISNEDMTFPGSAPSNIGGGGYFIIRNSWGCAGDAGYYYFPADYVSSLFSTIEALEIDSSRSNRWYDDQVTLGGTAGLEIDPKGALTVDLRKPTFLENSFTVTHPTAPYARLTITSNLDGVLFDGQWLLNPPLGGFQFGKSLPVIFYTQGLRKLTFTAHNGTQTVSATKYVTVNNSAPTIEFQTSGTPAQDENFVVNAVVTDINEANSTAMCAAMSWSVNAPDTIVSGSGCTRVIHFSAMGNREVYVSTQDTEGASGSKTGVFNVGPPLNNPYPRITTFGVLSRDYAPHAPGTIALTKCESNSVANNSTIDLRDIGCQNLIANATDKPRYYAQIGVENPAAEALSYDWTYTASYSNPAFTPSTITARTTIPSYDLPLIRFGGIGSEGTPYNCTVDVKVNAPELSRSKSLRVWSGQCINLPDVLH